MMTWLRNWWAKKRRLRNLKAGERACRQCGTAIRHKAPSYINKGGWPCDLSIYGPIGSYWLTLEHCPHCGWFSGRRYDTFGGSEVDAVVAERAWRAERDGALLEDAVGVRVLSWTLTPILLESQKEMVTA